MLYEGWTRGCDKTWRYIWVPPIKKRRRIGESVGEDDEGSLLGVGLNEKASSMLDTLNASGESLLQTLQYQIYHEETRPRYPTYSFMSLRERTMLILLFKGRNASGMLSHVLLPMITAFFPDTVSAGCAPSFSDEAVSGTRVVTFAKYAISRGRRHGKRPDDPIPLFMVAATIKVTEWRWAMVFEEMNGRRGIQVFWYFPNTSIANIRSLSLPKVNSLTD